MAEGYDLLILDTAGRLADRRETDGRAQRHQKAVHPEETLLLVDAMAGQDAVNVTNAFNTDVHLTGVIMSKLDGDAKGGAALSIKYLTDLPIKFAGVGEKVTDLDIFYPDRMADRILGMGDVVSLVEKAKEVIDEKDRRERSEEDDGGRVHPRRYAQADEDGSEDGSSLGAIAKMIPGHAESHR
jgi:signal recognition particle subunit SRP54